MKEDTKAPPQPAGSEDEEDEDEDDEEDDEEDEDDDEDVSEEEAEKEAPAASQVKRRPTKESEDESSESDDDDRTKEERLYDRAKRRIEVRGNGSRSESSSPFFLMPSLTPLAVSIETES